MPARLVELVGNMRSLPAHTLASIRHELPLMREIAEARTPVRTAWARLLADHGATDSWLEYVRMLPRAKTGTAHDLLDAVRARAVETIDLSKALLDIDRPFLHAGGPSTVLYRPGSSSYPSGHTIASFAQATVLTALDPAHAHDYAWMAREVGAARAYGGVHFMTDVRAGARLGVELGVRLLNERGIETAGITAIRDAVRQLDHITAYTDDFGSDSERIMQFARSALGNDALTSRTAAIKALSARYIPLGYDVTRQPLGTLHAIVPAVMRTPAAWSTVAA